MGAPDRAFALRRVAARLGAAFAEQAARGRAGRPGGRLRSAGAGGGRRSSGRSWGRRALNRALPGWPLVVCQGGTCARRIPSMDSEACLRAAAAALRCKERNCVIGSSPVVIATRIEIDRVVIARYDWAPRAT